MNSHSVKVVSIIFTLLSSYFLSAQTVELHLKKLLEKYRLPSISIAYIDDHGSWEHTTLGFRNTDSLTRVNDSTYYSAASLSKPVTAYITVLLAQEGRIDLKKPLAEYFEYTDLQGKQGYELVTFEMVLSHQSGLPNWRGINPLNFDFQPGDGFHYSGEGYLWLQKTIEHLLNQPWDEIAQAMLFQPLGMTNSCFKWTAEIEKNHASAHNKVLFPVKKWKPEQENAASSLQTNARDYALFLQELSAPTLLNPTYHLYFTSEVLQLKMYKKGARSVSWGLGIGRQESMDGLELWHWGDNGSDRAYFSFSPEKNRGFVYFCNSKNGLAMTEKLSDFFLGTPQVGYHWNGYKQQGKLLRLTSVLRRKRKLHY